MTTTETVRTLARAPLFSAVDAILLERLAAAARRFELARHELLFQRGDPADGLYLLEAGQIKLAVVSPGGDEKVLEIINPGMSFGEAVMLLGLPYPVFAEALQPSRLVRVERAPLVAAIEQEPRLAHAMLAGVSRRLHSVMLDLQTVSLRSAAQRVVGYLLRDAPQRGDGFEVALPAAKQLIASHLNLTPETFSRILRELQDDGLITVDGRRIRVLDRARLAAPLEG